ncbi:hypothetical protein B0H21DRAFT_689638 [Amylocystis lapponica]|nr:hypothetical protein B0H21DRAFT_689638 [Amylocystis lapponica]
MLGQKILQTFSYDDDADVDPVIPDPVIPAGPPAGLTLRRVKSKTLCIMTEGDDTVSPAPLANRTNKPSKTSHRISFQRSTTPDTSNTFGYPNPTTVPNLLGPPTNDVCVATAVTIVNLNARRQLRYLTAQRELEAKFQLCSSEASPQDLKIRALQRATDLLSAQARDAQERVAQLRERLADRPVLEPTDYRSMQHECWMETHRGAARDQQSKLLHTVLSKVSGMEHAADPVTAANRPAALIQTCRKANLARFFERSPTRMDFPQPRTLSSTVYRRNTISHVRSMRLRTSALTPVSARLKLPPLYVGSVPAVSLPGTPEPSFSASPSPSVRSDSLPPPSARAIPVEPFPVATARAMSDSSRSSSDAPSSSSNEGFASIYASSPPRTRAELAAELKDVSLPAYALDLLNGMGTDTVDVSLRTIHLRRPPSLHSLHSVHSIPDEPTPPPSPEPSFSPMAPEHPPANPTAHLRTHSTPHPRAKLPLPRVLRASLHFPRRGSQQPASSSSLYSIVEAEAEPTQPHPARRPYSSMGAYDVSVGEGGARGGHGVRTFVARMTSRLAMGSR